MSFELPPDARAFRDKVKSFVDSELRPLEVEAEMNGGRISDELR